MLSWLVIYKDKTVHQYSEETKNDFNIAHIDFKKLDMIQLKDPDALIPTFILHFDDKRKKPIFVIRNELPGRNKFKTRCYILGWQMNINGTNIQSINYIFETIGRKIMIQDPERTNDPEAKIEVVKDMCWIESAGKFDRARDSWFKSPSEKQLGIVGSKSHEVNDNGTKS